MFFHFPHFSESQLSCRQCTHREQVSLIRQSTIFGTPSAPLFPCPYTDYLKSIAYVPSWKAIKELVCKYLNSLDRFENKVMQGIDGIMFKGDASHKVTKLVYVNVDEKVYHGLYTLMNEYGEVIGWWFIRTGRMDELEECILNLRKRYEMNHFTRPIVVYSDRPEMDRSIWEKLWPSLRVDDSMVPATEQSDTNNTPFLTLPSGPNAPAISVIYKYDECVPIINSIRELLDMREGQRVLGFDLEWNRGGNPVATIQFYLLLKSYPW
jgi:hypothetical protein